MREVTRREAMKTALKAGAYATPVILSAVVPSVVSAATISGQPNADLTLSKAVRNPSPLPRNTATFRVSLTNNGPATATGVMVSDPLPTGTTLNGAVASQGSYSGVTGIWTVGTLTAGTTATLDVTLNLTSAAAVPNNVTVLRSSNNASATYTPAGAPGAVMLDVTIGSGSTPPAPHHSSVGFQNTGTVAATNVVVQVTVNNPYVITNVIAPPGTTASTVGTQTIIWTIPSVAAGGFTGDLLFDAPGSPGSLTITATVVDVDQFDAGLGTVVITQAVT